MNNNFYAVSIIDSKESLSPFSFGKPRLSHPNDFVKSETELEKENEKTGITKFTQVIGQVTDEVKNCLMQIQLSTDILERKLSNIDHFVSKEELEHINTGINLLDKTMENLYYLPPVGPDLQRMDVEEVWERMISPYSNFNHGAKPSKSRHEINTEDTELTRKDCLSEKVNTEEVEVEEFMQMLVIQTVGEVKNRLMQIQLSADILERKLFNLNETVSKEDYIKSITSGVNLLDETMEKFLCYAYPTERSLQETDVEELNF